MDFDRNTRIKMMMGGIQGLNSTELFYGMLIWKIQREVNNRMMQKYENNFNKAFQIDYIDDGADQFHYKYLQDYINITEEEYMKWKISINYTKTEIVMNTNNSVIISYIKLNFSQFKFNFQGNIKFLGVPHGTNQFVINEINKMYMKLQKKLMHIELINNRFMKLKMFKIYGL